MQGLRWIQNGHTFFTAVSFFFFFFYLDMESTSLLFTLGSPFYLLWAIEGSGSDPGPAPGLVAFSFVLSEYLLLPVRKLRPNNQMMRSHMGRGDGGKWERQADTYMGKN